MTTKSLLLLALLVPACTRSNPFASGDEDLGLDADGGSELGAGVDLAVPPDLLPCLNAGPEVCDGLDNDCNGLVDDGIPGAGVDCGPSTGTNGCVEKTACVPGAGVVCIGTFVAPTGSGSAPGTRAAPLSTLADGIRNAKRIGGGANVCACDPSGGASTTYTEDVTMVEGVSLVGGFNCSFTARDLVNNTTRIQNTVAATGLTFPAGLTSATALDGFVVRGVDTNGGMVSVAISVVDSSPALTDVLAQGGTAQFSAGLFVTRTGAQAARPTVTRGGYLARAGSGNVETAVSLDNGASAAFTGVVISNASNSATNPANSSIGLGCGGSGATPGCPGTTVAGGRVEGGPAVTYSVGLAASGDLTGVTVGTTARIGGGTVSSTMGSSAGITLDNCTGAPAFINNADIRGGAGSNGLRVGLYVKGAACAPTVTGGAIRGCETGATCVAVVCDAAPCAVTGAAVDAATTTTVSATGILCANAGCSALTRNTIATGAVATGANTSNGIGIDLIGASPLVDANLVSGPSCSTVGGFFGAGTLIALHLRSSSALVTNNVLRDRPCGASATVVLFEASDATKSPTLHSNTLEYTSAITGGKRAGLVIAYPGGVDLVAGTVRNNIIYNTGSGGVAIVELNAGLTLAALENNDLFDSTLYTDDAATSYSDVPSLESGLKNASGNISAAPAFGTPYHLTSSSPPKDKGTASGAPAHDRDGDARPKQGSYDIGADEY